MSRQTERARARAIDRISETQIEQAVRQDAELRAQKNFALEQNCGGRGNLAVATLTGNIGDDADAQAIKVLARRFLKRMFEKGLEMVEMIDYEGLDDDDEPDNKAPEVAAAADIFK